MPEPRGLLKNGVARVHDHYFYDGRGALIGSKASSHNTQVKAKDTVCFQNGELSSLCHYKNIGFTVVESFVSMYLFE